MIIKKTLLKFFLACCVLFVMSLLFDYKKPACVEAGCTNVPNIHVESENGMHCGHKCTDKRDLGIVTRRYCFLTQAKYEDLNSNNETASCYITSSGSPIAHWYIYAQTTVGNDTDATCYARCIAW